MLRGVHADVGSIRGQALAGRVRQLRRLSFAAGCIAGLVVGCNEASGPAFRELVLEDLGRPAVPRLARKINEIHEFGGKLYLGVGDWIENTGPTEVITFDPETRIFEKEFRAPEHAIMRFRELDGMLVVPGIDGMGPEANVLVLEKDGWNVRTLGTGKVSHIFDIASLGGKWFAGVDGWVVTSDDEGASWQRMRDARDGLPHQTRVVCLAGYLGKLYVFPLYAVRGGLRVLPDARGRQEADVWDGRAWTRLDILPAGFERCVATTTFEDDLVTYSYHAPPGATRKLGVLQRFDGTVSEEVSSPFQGAVEDLETAGGQLILLGKIDGAWKLGVTRDLVGWTVWSIPGDLGPLSAWIHEGRIYLGGDDGHLYRQIEAD